MREDNFYLTLISNSSMMYYPENKTTHFSTKLPKTMKLEGEWHVGIVEFQYPCTMLNVQEHHNVIYVSKNVKLDHEESTSLVTYKSHIPATDYDNINHLLSALNENPLLENEIRFRYDKISKLVIGSIKTENLVSLTLSAKLCIQLGFEPNNNFILNLTGKYPVNLPLGLPSQLFLYTDIIEPQYVGDVMSSLLRIIPLDPSTYIYGAYKTHIFSPAHYLSVMRREFDTIEIDIRTSTGEFIPFQFGTTCVKLHFKRVK